MSFKKFAASALAGTVTLAGLAMAMPAPAAAMTKVSELKDVSPDHWAYHAIKALMEKYHVMEGFPDGTFRGNKTVTRYELAAALARVMAAVDARIAEANGGEVSVEPGVNPEDLQTIARLQRQFREELDALKSRQDTIDSRVSTLEKRVRLSGSFQADYRDFSGSNALANQPWADFRVRSNLHLDAQLQDDLAWSSQLNVDLYNPQSVGNPFLRGVSNGAITDVYMPENLVHWTPGWIDMASGVGALRDHMQLGSTLADPFKTNVWTNATGGYGFVGTPGMNGSGALAQGLTANGLAAAPAWLPGTNVLVDVIDPNNSQAFAPTGNLLTTWGLTLGRVNLGLGFERGALASPYLMSGATTALPASIPGFQTWNAGSQAIATVGVDFGAAKLNLVGAGPALTYFNTSLNDKTLGAALDVGSEDLDLTLEALGNTSWTSGLDATKLSARLSSMNIGDSGFGAGIGMVAGDVSPMPALGASFGNTRSLFAGQADYDSWGVELKTPALLVIPSFTIAAQNTGAGLGVAGLGSPSLASGLTIGTDLNLFSLPTLSLEYSQGKFNANQDNTLWNTSSAISDEQFTVSTKATF
ncbi:MAG TPA: iron uptake porin [Oscillatoriaceae cyanobacterium]